MAGARREGGGALAKRRQVGGNGGMLRGVISGSFPMYGLRTGLLSHSVGDSCVPASIGFSCGIFGYLWDFSTRFSGSESLLP